MPELVTCPQCQRQLRIPDELMNRLVKCPSCGTTFTGTPAAAPPPAAPPPSPGVFAKEPARPPAMQTPEYPNQGFDDRRGAPIDAPYIRRDVAPHRGVLILVFGIISLVIPLVGIGLGPAAWIMGNNDLAQIRAGRMDREGEGLTQAGRICGMIASILILCGCICYGAIFIIAFSGSVAAR